MDEAVKPCWVHGWQRVQAEPAIPVFSTTCPGCQGPMGGPDI
jgi:hypothetical protein